MVCFHLLGDLSVLYCVLTLDGIPSDGTPERRYSQINQFLFIIYTILAGAGILFAIICLFFNIIFRKRK